MFPRAALVVLGVLLAIIVAIISVIRWTGWPFQYYRAQMAVGRVYMDSLTEKDIPEWIDRTEKLLSEYKPGMHPIGVYGLGGRAKPIPPDLSELKIIRIDITENEVSYVWMGGLDHTELQVHRLKDGSFQFVAQYNDATSKVMWPKE
jgi:hypothetical protein